MMKSLLDYSCQGLSDYDSTKDADAEDCLTTLELHENNIVSVTLDAGVLKNLVKLSLHNNRLTELPLCVCRLHNLVWLSLHYNRLSFLPEDFGRLKKLQRLSLHQNELTELPDSFKNLKYIVVLSLFRNDLRVLENDVFSNFSMCKKLALHQNKNLCLLPTSVARMTSLEDLWIGDTGIHPDTVPKHIGKVWT